jgi:hypothetical protein
MSSNHRQPKKATGSRGAPGRALLAVAAAALVLALLTGTAISAGAGSGDAAKVERLRSELARMTRLANRGLRPAALRLGQDLPAERDRLSGLREPASTAQAQVKVALNELQEMTGIASLDPHYPSALVAAGRAYIAVSGLDPVTGTAVNPEYRGLERELATSGEQLERSAADAGELSADIARLGGELSRSQRRARLVERRLRRRSARAGRAGRR